MSSIFDNSYARLPDRFYAKLPPEPVTAPALLKVNDTLADALGIDTTVLTADVIAGNTLLEGAEPLAQAYAGHQFGGWVPQLGDGRAVLLGEIDSPIGRRDIQLKGSGRTPFSRNGDGRAWLGPVMREYIVSEAMHALGVPTTRALGAALTGEKVQRERAYPGAVLMRVAASHIRVGTFQYFAARNDTEALEALLQHAAARHHPDATTPMAFLAAVTKAQAELIAHWMRLGFIHGVMNTDNMTVSGETIDYGPCAFMDAYHPSTVFSSIDQNSRYAFQNQPNMAVWDLAQLATSLLAITPGDQDEAVGAAEDVLKGFADQFSAKWLELYRAKLGLTRAEDGDEALITGLLQRMASSQSDFTATFASLADGKGQDHVTDDGAWDSWAPDWQARLAREDGDTTATMRGANPVIIPRNHRIEQAIQAGITGDFTVFHRLCDATQRPFAPRPEDMEFAAAPEMGERVMRTFCGT